MIAFGIQAAFLDFIDDPWRHVGRESEAAPDELFDEAARRNMRLIAGLAGIDRLAPPGYASSPEDFYRDSKRLIERYHRQGRGLYAITPRSAHVATHELMAVCERLKREH